LNKHSTYNVLYNTKRLVKKNSLQQGALICSQVYTV